MAPDFEYLLRLAPRGRFGHSPPGLFLFCLPLGVAAWLEFRKLVRPALRTLLPAGIGARWNAPATGLLAVAAGVLVGAFSHIVWDGFTHAKGWGVSHLPILAHSVPVAGEDVAVFRILQHFSTVVGLAMVVAWVTDWVSDQPPELRVYTPAQRMRAQRIVLVLLAAGTLGAVLNGLRGVRHGLAGNLGYAAVGGMAALAVALTVFGVVVACAPDGRARRL